MKIFLYTFLIGILTFLSTASAQEKPYVWTYPYGTVAANEFELESNSFLFTPSASGNSHSLVQQFELEYGLTDRLQLGLYQVFNRKFPSGNLSAQSFMIEALYTLAQRNKLAVDPMVYLEYERGWDHRDPNHIEAKLILSKDIGRWNGTLNGIGEYEFGGTIDFTPELSAGVSYQIVEGFRAGFETFTMLSDEDGDNGGDEDFGGTGIGPTFAVETPWFNITTGATFGITRTSNAFNFCTNLDIDL